MALHGLLVLLGTLAASTMYMSLAGLFMLGLVFSAGFRPVHLG